MDNSFADAVENIIKLNIGNNINAFEKIERNGKLYYHIGGSIYDWDNDEDTDICRTAEGFVAVTPLIVDMTDVPALRARGVIPRFSGRLAES